ncbi:MAG: Asp-tRNA(Asn)/Glu-tRNA(Gln) amidotransferase subunit GatC [Gemmatimonadota bacterium]
MSVTEQDVRHIASLARLELDDARTSSLVRELNGILAHMDVLQAVDMSAAASDEDAIHGATPLRPDALSSLPLASERGTFAPNYQDGFFLVPRLSTHE